MPLREFINDAIATLCARFEQGGYNPTPILDLGVLVTRAHGKVEDDDLDQLREVFEWLLDARLNREVVGHLVAASLSVIEVAGVEARARLLAAILKDCDAVEEGIVVALAIAFASRGLTKEERAVIEMVADAGRLPRARLDELVETVRKKIPDEAAGPVSARDSLRS